MASNLTQEFLLCLMGFLNQLFLLGDFSNSHSEHQVCIKGP